MLTGKNKEQFEKYLVSNEIATVVFDDGDYTVLLYDFPLSMQFGVVQDYVDSIGYSISTATADTVALWEVCSKMNLTSYEGEEKNLDEARLAAIKAFDEIVNADKALF